MSEASGNAVSGPEQGPEVPAPLSERDAAAREVYRLQVELSERRADYLRALEAVEAARAALRRLEDAP